MTPDTHLSIDSSVTPLISDKNRRCAAYGDEFMRLMAGDFISISAE